MYSRAQLHSQAGHTYRSEVAVQDLEMAGLLDWFLQRKDNVLSRSEVRYILKILSHSLSGHGLGRERERKTTTMMDVNKGRKTEKVW